MSCIQTILRGLKRGWPGASLAALLLAWAPAWADATTDWNAIAADAVTASGRNSSQERAHVMAVVNAAMYEAVSSSEAKQGSQLLVSSPAPADASTEAAAAAAAHYVLSRLYPEQQVSFSLALVRSLEAIPDGEDKVVGQITGTRAGKRVYSILAPGQAK